MLNFISNSRGNVAILFALAILPVGMFVGAALDFSRHQTNGVELSSSLDASALATARYVMENPGLKENDVAKFAEEYLNANFHASSTKTLEDISVEFVENSHVRISAMSEIETSMLSLAGIKQLKSKEVAQASFGAPSALRAVLVLDNSSSMSGEKMDALKEAADDFVSALTEANGGSSASASTVTSGNSENAKTTSFTATSSTSAKDDDDDDFDTADTSSTLMSGGGSDSYIGIVPFNHYVNVGTDHQHADWISVPNKKTSTKSKCSVNTSATLAVGCEKKTKACTGSSDGMSYDATCSYWDCPSGASTVLDCTDVSETSEWCGAVVSRKPPLNVSDSDYDTDPVEGYLTPEGNEGWECAAPIMPMTNNSSEMTDYIDDLKASGDTYIAPGLMWGYRVLSPGAPFTEMAGKDINSSAIVLMSDGMNSRSYKSWSNGSDHYGTNRKAADEDTLAACSFIKSQDVEIYAIAFQIDDKDTEDMLKDCATTFSHYYDADSIEQLKEAFSDVAASFREVALTE